MTRVSLRRSFVMDSVSVEPALLTRVGFTDHAIQRFAERAGLGSTNRRVIEPIIRGLLLTEGRVVPRRPPWARSQHQSDLYLQLGQWMLLIGCHDRHRDGRYAIVTAVNGPANNSWRTAWRRGDLLTPPPMPTTRGHPSAIVSAVRAFDERRPGERLLAAIIRTHRGRRESAQADYDRALAERSGGTA